MLNTMRARAVALQERRGVLVGKQDVINNSRPIKRKLGEEPRQARRRPVQVDVMAETIQEWNGYTRLVRIQFPWVQIEGERMPFRIQPFQEHTEVGVRSCPEIGNTLES